MSWTYDASLLDATTAIGRRTIIRLRIGDTRIADQQLQDEEIDYFLTASSDNIRTAALSCLRAIVAFYSREADMWMGHTRIERAQRARAYQTLLATMEADTSSSWIDVEILFSGQSIAEKQSNEDDNDLVQPGFKVGSDDIDGRFNNDIFDDGV